jgi:gliding motility-associated-like protein
MRNRLFVLFSALFFFSMSSIGSQSLPPAPNANAGFDQSTCGFSITLNANDPQTGIGLWTQVAGPGTATFANPNARNSSVSVSVEGVYTFAWTITEGAVSTSDNVNITFYNNATVANAGTDQNVCGLTTFLVANNPTFGFGNWFTVSGPGAISFSNPNSPSSSIEVFANGTYTLQWTIFNGVCPITSDQVSITFDNNQVVPNAGSDATFCGLTYALSGNNPAPSIGSWTFVSGPGTATFDNATAFNSNVTVSTAGNYTFRWTINNATCPSAFDEVNVTLNFANETCNGIDDNCNGLTDEGVLNTYYLDADNDTFGNPAISIQGCSAPIGYVSNNQDCNDNNTAINPFSNEVCNNADDNCNGQIDEGVLNTYFFDGDGDNFGNPSNTTLACAQPLGYVSNGTDCNDNVANINPATAELCNLIDDNCNNQTDEGVQQLFYADADTDTFGNSMSTILACTPPNGYVTNNLDCNDNNQNIYPAALEICNNLDDNCNTSIDEGLLFITYYADLDGDGAGNLINTTIACAQPNGYVTNPTDCNDSNPTIYPSASETCNGTDDNCNTSIDEGVQNVFYIDSDSDFFGNAAFPVLSCTNPVGYVSNNSDCNDANNFVYPNANEICNGIDDDCDTFIDEGVQIAYYADADNDGFGNALSSILACSLPVGYVINATDCNDNNANIRPGVVELCNNIDDNCNTLIDEGVLNTYYADSDSDGFGDINATTSGCIAPAGYVSNFNDCNDSSSNVYPGATEVCNQIDENCNGAVDEGVQNLYFLDADGDTFGSNSQNIYACTLPAGYVTNDLDCNDNSASAFPGATELCNALDDNCNNQIDDGLVVQTYFADSDSDTFGNPLAPLNACIQPIGYVIDNTDCNDNISFVNPNGTELCNLLDDNCNGLTDEGVQVLFYADQDEDGFGGTSPTTLACSAPAGYSDNSNDCNDSNSNIYPEANELCNLIDDNCNTLVDEGVLLDFYLDSDGDSFGTSAVTTQACSQPFGYSSNNIDCNDSDAGIQPAASEICNLADENCNGQIDEGVQLSFYADNDNDNYGNPDVFTLACTQPNGFVLNSSDCNDNNAGFNPSISEICNLQDENCNGFIDEGVQLEFYADADLDTYGSPSNTILACTLPAGYVTNATDCDDSDDYVQPGAIEICNSIDDNCNNQVDENIQFNIYFEDADGDSFGDPTSTISFCTLPFGYVSNNTDCDDNSSFISPLGTEVCNLLDDNCNGLVDEGVQTIFYLDFDNDGFGNGNSNTLACSLPLGYSSNSIDCNDNSAMAYPGANELCNLQDDDCDLLVDENATTTFYLDMDSDGFGNIDITTTGCTPPPGYVINSADCNDASFSTNPLAAELCNTIDDNCNTLIDEGVQLAFYLDADGDTFGGNIFVIGCTAPSGFVSNNADCNDASIFINPLTIEICNNIDDNCNLQIDEGVLTTYFPDFDNDGFGNTNLFVQACSAPTGFVTLGGDCNDTTALVSPAMPELCNQIDDNCNAQIDEGVSQIYYADLDGDTFGDLNNFISSCTQPSGYTSNTTDCDDTNPLVNPTATEICNQIDDDCNGTVDDGLIFETYLADLDGDGFGDVGTDSIACSLPNGYLLFTGGPVDCDGSDSLVNPNAIEICNNIDDNCNLEIDENLTEGLCADPDLDGVNNLNDLDDDNDGITDETENLTASNNGDTDLDGIPDTEDLDSDNDGIFDVIENLGDDPDGNGTIGSGDITDTNGNGLEDSIEPDGMPADDYDGDGTPNFQDLDSDNDTLLDEIENDVNADGTGPDDTDGDGNFNFLDTNDDDDQWLTIDEIDFNLDGIAPDDCDFDGVPNYLDVDPCNLFIPEGFSPNGDGTNDFFEIENVPANLTYSLEIFNIWGDKVYQSENYKNDWDGENLPTGTYYYVVKFSETLSDKSGYLTLWR